MKDINIADLIEKIESEYDEIEPGALTADARFKDIIHWNSMNSLVMTVMIEYEYKVLINEKEMKEIQTINDLATLIMAKSGQ